MPNKSSLVSVFMGDGGMDMTAHQSIISYTDLEQLRMARSVLNQEATAILKTAQALNTELSKAVDLICNCTGSVIVTGIGKAGLVGQKISATFSSTGTSSHFLHPAEAVHGNLGCLKEQDVIFILSNSGETEEIVRLLPIFDRFGLPLIALTAEECSTLGQPPMSF